MPNTHTTLSSLFTAIANALRSLKGTSAPIVADDFPSEIISIPTKSAQTYTPTTADQTIAAGQYLSGAQTVKGDANLVAENIKKDVTIFGVTGSHEGGGGSIALQSITITTAPTKTSYYDGDSFDPTGMVVTAAYTNGASRVITGYTYSPQTLALGDTGVTVSFTEDGVTKTATQAVTVIVPTGNIVYGFHVDSSESDPSNCVTYLEDAVGLTPAAMNFSTGVFSYGDWENAFFMPRPCMLKYDGTVDYYLDPNDFSKKTDGTASDIADASYGGNAMMEWGDGISKIYMKVVGDNGDPTSGSVYIADRQIDDDYHCWPFINNQGDEVAHFYTPIYGGSIDGNGKLRSLSGKTLSQNKTMTQQSDAARANNPGDSVLWDIENLAERMLVNALLILMGKSLNTQAVFGNGRQGQASNATSLLTTGTLDDKGLFWGASDDTHDVKVFGMSWWGNQWRRVNGYLLVNGVIKVKMTHGRQDGTTADDYNQTGSGYISLGSLGTYSGAFQEAMTFNGLGFFPRNAGGSSASSTTFWCDPIWTNTSDTRAAALFGGHTGGTAGSPGAFCVYLYNEPAASRWGIGAAPSCKPLAP